MDPLTSLGLVSNVVQLLTFVGNLLDKTRGIYSTADGVVIENQELETIARTLGGLGKFVQRSSGNTNKQPGNTSISKDKSAADIEDSLQLLCQECQTVTHELLSTLQKLKLQGDRSAWKSFRRALSCIWSESKIADLSSRIEKYRRQIDTLLLISLRNQLIAIGKDGSLEELLRAQGALKSFYSSQTAQALLHTVQTHNLQQNEEPDVEKFSAALSLALIEDHEAVIKRKLLELLKFTEIQDRYMAIEEAHQQTFRWIFHHAENALRSSSGHSKASSTIPCSETIKALPPANNFLDWMKGPQRLYWITGKPGSGKSTLMKYLKEHYKTAHTLKMWAEPYPLITTGFFFWNSGTVMQMSRLGLLRSLLVQVLEHRPHMLPILFERRWNAHVLFGGDSQSWTWLELTNALETLVADQELRFAFFIDGLDECDGDSMELCRYILKLAKFANVKLCVASRPLLAVEEAFEGRPRLRMEELTREDIHLFVANKLRSSPMFLTLERYMRGPAADLIFGITERAQGVFLWVRLVVQSLIDGCRDGDNIMDLQARFRALPSDLDGLFRQILDQLHPQYFKDTSELFQLAEASNAPLQLIDISFAQDGLEAAMRKNSDALTDNESNYRAEASRRRIMSRTKGLLQTPEYDSRGITTEVTYLHRTAKDFLRQQKYWEHLLSGAQSFNPNHALALSWLLRVKRKASGNDAEDDFWNGFFLCVYHLKKTKDVPKEHYTALFEELLRASEEYWASDSTWSNNWERTMLDYMESPYLKFTTGEWFPAQTPFEQAFRLEIAPYIAIKLAEQDDIASELDCDWMSLATQIENNFWNIRWHLNIEQNKESVNEEAIRNVIITVLRRTGVMKGQKRDITARNLTG